MDTSTAESLYCKTRNSLRKIIKCNDTVVTDNLYSDIMNFLYQVTIKRRILILIILIILLILLI